MPKIKICGLKRFQDIDYVNMLKPDYAGFVFAKSKRQISVEFAKELIKGLDKDIKTVGVFVNENKDNVRKIASFLNLDVLQFHGDETPEYIENFSDITLWKAIGIKGGEDIKKIGLYTNADALVLDNSSGGTGQCFNWDIIKNLDINKPIILAGGLNPENIELAIENVNPYGIDVSSGVETDGYKDFKKIEKFILKARKLI